MACELLANCGRRTGARPVNNWRERADRHIPYIRSLSHWRRRMRLVAQNSLPPSAFHRLVCKKPLLRRCSNDPTISAVSSAEMIVQVGHRTPSITGHSANARRTSGNIGRLTIRRSARWSMGTHKRGLWGSGIKKAAGLAGVWLGV